MKETIKNSLLRRLQAAGIRRLFGVPGDYTWASGYNSRPQAAANAQIAFPKRRGKRN
jgi:hypothetical protein